MVQAWNQHLAIHHAAFPHKGRVLRLRRGATRRRDHPVAVLDGSGVRPVLGGADLELVALGQGGRVQTLRGRDLVAHDISIDERPEHGLVELLGPFHRLEKRLVTRVVD